MPDSSPTKGSLAARRRLQTQDEVSTVAIRLFTEVGFDETSMEDIADEAGVSRRTVYRHFATKADLVFEHPRRWLEHFQATLETEPDATKTRERCERAIAEIAQLIAANPEPVLDAFAVRMANPILGATHSSSDAKWSELIFTSLLAEHGPEKIQQSMICAGALVGATNALFLGWSLAYPDADLVSMTTATLQQCDGLWP